MRIRKPEFTQAQLMEALHYDPETGVFTWRNDRQSNAKAGSVAGFDDTAGYRSIGIGMTTWKAHRLAWFYVHGIWPEALIDHMNQDKLDNRIANLRLATISQNRQNMTKYRSNTSGFKGVHWFKATSRWQAQIKHEGRRYHLGFFKNAEDAAAAYRTAAARLHIYNPEAALAARS